MDSIPGGLSPTLEEAQLVSRLANAVAAQCGYSGMMYIATVENDSVVIYDGINDHTWNVCELVELLGLRKELGQLS